MQKTIKDEKRIISQKKRVSVSQQKPSQNNYLLYRLKKAKIQDNLYCLGKT